MRIDRKTFDEFSNEKFKQNRINDVKPKNTSEKLYNSFQDFLYLHSFNIQKKEDFDIYFEDFLEINYGENRLDFSDKTKTNLMHKSAGLCAICGIPTIYINRSGEAENIGIACHIISASKYGPRTDLNKRKNPKIIKSESNGFWGCPTCHVKIDKDENTYTVETLEKKRNKHYEFVSKLEVENVSLNDYFEIKDNLLELKNLTIKMEEKDSLINMMLQQLRNAESEYIEKISFFELIELTKNKKAKEFGNGKLEVFVDNFKTTVEIDGEEIDNKTLEEKAKQFKTAGKYDNVNYGKETEIDRLIRREQEKYISKEDVFIINKTKKNIVRLKNDSFKIIKGHNFIRLVSKNNKLFIDINKEKDGYSSKIIVPEPYNILEELNLIFSFLYYLEDFSTHDLIYLAIPYKNETYHFHINMTHKNT